MIGVQDDHFGRPAGLAAALDRAGAGVSATHKAQGAAGRTGALAERFEARADVAEVDSRAGTALENHALFDVPIQDGRHGVFDAQDKASTGLLGAVERTDIEPDGRIKSRSLGSQDVL